MISGLVTIIYRRMKLPNEFFLNVKQPDMFAL
jgi:hypothetical protein